MTEETIDRHIEDYLSQEENLNRLRRKILNLEGYQLRSEFEEEKKLELNALRDRIKDMEESHEAELNRIKENHQNELQKEKENFDEYRQSVEQQVEEAAKNQKELARWQADYGELAAAYDNFSALNLKHRNEIAGIFGGCDTPGSFFCGAFQKGHLEQLWDYVRDEIVEEDVEEEEQKRLSSLFDFSFEAVNCSQREPLFRRLAASVGDAFDGDIMSRTAKSPQLGRVERLVFAGFAHEVTGNVVRRSLVELN